MKATALYKQYATTEAIGYCTLSNWGGLELLDMDQEQAVACFNWGTGRQQIRHHKIQFTTAGCPYIRKQGTRFYLADNGTSTVIMRAF